MTTDATDEQVQRISEANSWLRGPTDLDWLYVYYDACAAPLLAPENAPRKPA
jgi:6-hydroxynicotinate 3-monooxygenase